MSNTDNAVTGTTPAASPGSSAPEAPRLSRRSRWDATDLALIAVFAAIVAGSALIAAIPVGGLGVPITLQTLAVMLTGLALGPGRAFAAVGLYLLLGFAGLPIFSGGRSGLGVLAGPSAGYIFGFLLAATAVRALTVVVLRPGRHLGMGEHQRRLGKLWFGLDGGFAARLHEAPGRAALLCRHGQQHRLCPRVGDPRHDAQCQAQSFRSFPC